MLALCKPEDYVVFKLDIDHNELEVQLILQLLNSPKLLGLVDELFWDIMCTARLCEARVSFMGTNDIGWGDHTPPKSALHSSLEDSYMLLRD